MTLAIFHEAGIPPRSKVSATISRINSLFALATQATTPDGTRSSPGALLGLTRERALSTCSGVTSGIPLQYEERRRIWRGRDKRGACARTGPTAGVGEEGGRGGGGAVANRVSTTLPTCFRVKTMFGFLPPPNLAITILYGFPHGSPSTVPYGSLQRLSLERQIRI